jgi:hypothetical protein
LLPASLVHCDSTATIAKIKNYYNGKKQHIRHKHNTIRESISNGAVRVNFVRTKENLVDPSTKGLNREKVQDTSSSLGLIHIAHLVMAWLSKSRSH